MLEDLTLLKPKRLERRLEQLSREALRCVSATVFEGDPEHGLTVALVVESQGRPDVRDLARVLESEPGGQVTTSWSLLTPNRRHPYFRLLLHVDFERPVLCSFVVRFDVTEQATDELRGALRLVLAAAGFALAFDGFLPPGMPLPWVAAPAVRDCVFDALAALN
jgi:hypothetical protein